MPVIYRQRVPLLDAPPLSVREYLTVGAGGVFARLERDARGSWRGVVLIAWGRRGKPAHKSRPVFRVPGAVTEGEAVHIAEREIRACVSAATQSATRGGWWQALPVNAPDVSDRAS